MRLFVVLVLGNEYDPFLFPLKRKKEKKTEDEIENNFINKQRYSTERDMP
jgi:hypothetical protein